MRRCGDMHPELAAGRPMMRWTAMLLSAVVIVFSLTFIVTRRTAATPPAAPQLVEVPIAAATPLRVRTLRGAPPLPRLRSPRSVSAAPAAPAAAAAAPLAAAAPMAPVAPPPSASSNPPPEVLCARAALMRMTGGAPALPRTGRC